MITKRDMGLGLSLFLLLAGPTAAQEAAAPAAEEKPAEGLEPEGDPLNVTEEIRISRQGLGLDPGALNFGGMVLPPPPGSQVTAADRRANALNYHGFLRAPMRIGIGSGSHVMPGVPEGAKLHSPPRVPDSSYTNWQYTNNIGGPWTEMQFSYGNAKVFGTVSVASYNLSDANYRELVAQLGINQAWVTFNLPDLFGDRGGILWNVGVFSAGYGAAGRYDAGAYGTYLFGRTHTSGETVSAFYDITDDLTLQLEHGIGARLDVQQRIAGLEAPYLPYPGPVQQFPTLLHHAHAGVTFRDKVRFAAHYLTQWTQSATTTADPDGRITSYGVEVKAYDTQFGNAYFGIARLDSTESLRVAGAFEALHSWEGWSLKDNYFPGELSTGTGSITSVMWQYTFSLATFLRYPESFWGQGPDLLLSTFGLFNSVSSDEGVFSQCAEELCARKKLKLGGEATYTPLGWLGVSARYDLVQPNLANARTSFSVLSPRLLFRTEFISHEQIILMYSRYFNKSETVLSYPYDEMMSRADENVFSIIATMWW
jgi:hypothetical protein